MEWKTLLAYITGSVDRELLLRNEYLVTENRMLRQQIPGRVRLTDAERKTLAEMGKKSSRQALAEVASIVTPDTILAWHRKFVAQKFDGAQQRKPPSRPPIAAELEALAIRMAQENRSWGYDRIAGALQHLGYTISDQTVGNILKRHGILPAPNAKRPPRGKSSSGRIWTYWSLPTFLPLKSGCWVDSSPITSCSLSGSAHGKCMSLESRHIPLKRG